MNDISGVHEEDASEYLVDKILDMIVTELLPRVYDTMKICLHQICYDVYVVVVGAGLGLKDI